MAWRWSVGPVILLAACWAEVDVKDESACGADLSPCADGGRCWDGVCLPAPACPDGDCAGERSLAVPDTNLRTCVGPAEEGASGAIECPGSPGAPDCADTALCGQDAQYGWDLDHADGARWAREGDDEPVVTDAVTGMTWAGCALGLSGPDCAEGEALIGDAYAAEEACAALEWGGYSDWELASADALHLLVDFSRTGPAVDDTAFPGTPGDYPDVYDAWWEDCHWSSTLLATDPEVAWVLMTNSGDIAEGSGTEYHLNDRAADGWAGCAARCARGAPLATRGRFQVVEEVAGEGVVIDHAGGRAWTACAAGQSGADCSGEAALVPWEEALAWCEGLVWGGRDDWRLPDVVELRSIVDLRYDSPSVDPALFPGTPYYGEDTRTNVGQFWSSTGRDYNSFALYVEFRSGFSHFYVMDEGRHARCVR